MVLEKFTTLERKLKAQKSLKFSVDSLQVDSIPSKIALGNFQAVFYNRERCWNEKEKSDSDGGNLTIRKLLRFENAHVKQCFSKPSSIRSLRFFHTSQFIVSSKNSNFFVSSNFKNFAKYFCFYRSSILQWISISRRRNEFLMWFWTLETIFDFLQPDFSPTVKLNMMVSCTPWWWSSVEKIQKHHRGARHLSGCSIGKILKLASYCGYNPSKSTSELS